MYRYALRPRWLASHAFALFVVVLFVNLGLWQLRRHDERADRNALVEARALIAPDDVRALLDGVDGDDVEDLRYRVATVTGTYGETGPLLVDNRSKDGLPGAWVLSPLTLDDGTVVVVNRGFQGFADGELDPVPPASGQVTVTGLVIPWVDRGCGVRTDAAGDVVGMACLRRSGAEAAFGTEVAPVVVQRNSSASTEDATLAVVPPPELGSGPHRGYAGQWFIFATIVAVVYVLILRKVARERAIEEGGLDVGAEPVGVGDG